MFPMTGILPFSLPEYFQESPDIPQDLLVSEEHFVKVLRWQIQNHPSSEVSLYGVIQLRHGTTPLEHEIVWITPAATGDFGSITTSAQEILSAMEDAMKAGYDIINLQMHTHGTNTAFWSGTDLHAQHKTIHENITSPGEMWYIVIGGGMDWQCRHYVWTGDGTVKYADGKVYLLPDKLCLTQKHTSLTFWANDPWEPKDKSDNADSKKATVYNDNWLADMWGRWAKTPTE